MNFNENNVWREKTELLNLKLSKLARAKGSLKLEFDTKDQVLYYLERHLKDLNIVRCHKLHLSGGGGYEFGALGAQDADTLIFSQSNLDPPPKKK